MSREPYSFSEVIINEMIRENAVRREILTRPYDPIAGDPEDPSPYRHLPPAERSPLDFPFWAFTYVRIKPKGGGVDIPFRLNRPQLKLVKALESMRIAGEPIRLVLLKARQWGGSTCVQIYMAWLQLIHQRGLNSLIIAHQGLASDEILEMFDRMMEHYPRELLTDEEGNPPGARNLSPAGISRGSFRVAGRNCKIRLGTAERPDSCRGGDYNLVHCSEVAYWPDTTKKTPEQIMRSATAGILFAPMTMIVLESTANGTENFFNTEYEAAKSGESQFRALFVAWFEIARYSLPVADLREFARELYANRHSRQPLSARRESGAYLWMLWLRGASLEGIAWYIKERSKYQDHAQMASEYPTDDIEAFVHSGNRVFDKYQVEALKPSCSDPLRRGELDADARFGPQALESIRFSESAQGAFAVWEMPAKPEQGVLETDRYLVAVDIGGRSLKSDWSVIAVFDRMEMEQGGKPRIVAQWRGHVDMDTLAWYAARVARFYNEALLVIESNTVETRDASRIIDPDQSLFLLSQIRDEYPNLYARRQSEDEVLRGMPRKYGFHTNTATKPMVIAGLIQIIREGLYVERDKACLHEYLTYEQKPNGSYGAIRGRHDDLLMTRAIGLHICFHEMPLPRRILTQASRRSRDPRSAAYF